MTFEDQQRWAYAFLDTFYTRADFGYDVKHHSPSEVNQTVIDIVNQMGNDIYTNTRVVTIASEVFQKIASILAGGAAGFIVAMATEIITGDLGDSEDITGATKKQLLEEKERYRGNSLAWSVVTQVMAREKGNIELAFMGFI